MERDLVARKVARAAAWLDDVEARIAVEPAAFVADADRADLAAFHLQLAVQECVDLAGHWISARGWPPPDRAGAAFDALAARGAIPGELAAFMRGATSLRNRIAHGYVDVDPARLQAECSAGLPELRRFLDLVARAAGA